MRAPILLGLAVTALPACAAPQSTTASSAPAPTSRATPVSEDAGSTSASSEAPDAAASADAATTSTAYAPRALRFAEIASVLFGEGANRSSAVAACPASEPIDPSVQCLLDRRYHTDPKAAELARELFRRWRVAAGVDAAFTMDGGYRGMIRIEPALPVATERKHLEWVVLAMRDFDQFFDELDRHGGGSRATFHFEPRALRFMRSVAARTPSAYASDWSIAWNLSGSLHTSADAARETLFHEIFHLNDEVHPLAAPAAGAWSFRALHGTYEAIVKKCGTRAPCLEPYSPNDTMVRGGTYYSFQPGNDVREYAAELALRYYREQRAALRSLSNKPKRFKCGPPENVYAWGQMRDEFFGGIDVVPACDS